MIIRSAITGHIPMHAQGLTGAHSFPLHLTPPALHPHPSLLYSFWLRWYHVAPIARPVRSSR